MARTYAHTAVYAGLMSMVVMAHPTSAFAQVTIQQTSAQTTLVPAAYAQVAHAQAQLPLPNLADLPQIDPQQVLPFSVGVIVGAALCAGIVMGSDALTKRAAEKNRAQAENDITNEQPAIAARAAHEFTDGRAYTPSHAARGWDQAQDPSATQVARASHATNDYEQIAENKARVAAARERKEVRKRGVGSVLLERLGAGFGANMMDGLPVIPRADGTIADVGTSWWHASVDKSTMREGFSDFEMPTVWETAQMEEAELTAAAKRSGVWSSVATTSQGRTAPSSMSEAQVREGGKRRFFSADDEVNNGAHTVQEADASSGQVSEQVYGQASEQGIVDDDLWQSAMAAMDGLSREESPFEFADVVGAGESLDDPDDLESPTMFIPFRTPAGHPEVVDTESYISYILEDEFSKLESQSVKRTAKNYLKVIEGGTTRVMAERKKSGGAHYVPKHMKPQAQEA